MEDIFFSLVVATLNRTDELRSFLDSLLLSKYKSFEVIIADQNQDNRLDEILAGYAGRIKLKHVRLNARNACRARNTGFRHAAGEWVAFPDDDCCYTADTFSTAMELINSKPGVNIFLGAVTDFEGKPLTKFKVKASPVHLFNMNGKMSEAAIFSKRTGFKQISGFDEKFGPGGPFFAAEGYEYLARALKAGQKVYFDSSIRILHPHKTRTRDAAAFHIGYTRTFGVGCLLQKHFGLWAVWYLAVYLTKFLLKMAVIFEPSRRQYAVHCQKALIKGLFHNLRHA